MNLIEAAKSGKRFRRKIWSDKSVWFHPGDIGIFLNIQDLLATDWEIEQTVTKKKMFNAIYKSENFGLVLSGALYESEEDARKTLRDQFVALGPAVEFEVIE